MQRTMMAGNYRIQRLFSGGVKPVSKGESASSSGARFPKNFDMDRAVGLGIVAAMKDGDQLSPLAVPIVKSDPIAIVFSPSSRRKERRAQEEEMELSESYTRVISHLSVSKTVYLENGWELSSAPPVAALSRPEDFLCRCYRCGKNLDGIDIFMYRGEKGFCSAECRRQQMLSEEQREKKPFECSMSPCSATAPIFFSAGVAAA